MAYFTKTTANPFYLQGDGRETIETFSDEPYPELFGVVLENWSVTENNAKKITEKLRSMFELKNKEAIGYYLSYNQFLLPILKKCYQNIKRYFKQNEPLVLELIHDPMDNIEKLVIYIVTNMAPKDSINLLREFYKGWWIIQAPEIRRNIIIDVEST